MQNTSRANKAMLENEILKKQDLTNRTNTNVEKVIYKFRKQKEFMDSLDDLNLSTESSFDSDDGELKKLSKDFASAKTS